MKPNMGILKYIKKTSFNLSYIINNNVKILLLLGLVNYIYIIKKILENKYRFVLLFFIVLSTSYFIFKNFFIITTILILFDISNLLKLDIIEGANSSKEYDKLLKEQNKDNEKDMEKDCVDDEQKDTLEANVDIEETGNSSNENAIEELDNQPKGERPFKKKIKMNNKDTKDLKSFKSL